jgi:hypothetical protein
MLIDESLAENLSKLIINVNATAIADKRNRSTSSLQQQQQQQQYTTFDETLFGKIFTAYFQLDKVTQFFDKLNGYLLHAINFQLQQTIICVLVSSKIAKYSSNNSNSSDDDDDDEDHIDSAFAQAELGPYLEELRKLDIHELFKLISHHDYKQAIGDLCLNLWSIMKNYYRICVWIVGNYGGGGDAATMAVLEKKLSSGLQLVWKEVQQRTSQLFRSMSFEGFKFDEFINILTVLNKLAEFGHEFCDNPSFRVHPEIASKILLSAVKDQTLAYFRAIHM